MRSAPATMLATATGTSERGRHSKSSNSTARRMAAIGAANVADMPAAAPATSRVVRSRIAEFEPLRDQRPERSARHDDRTFGAERAAGTDGDGGRNRFEDRDLGINPRPAQQDRLDGFRNPVSANLVRSVMRHQPHQQAADDGTMGMSHVRQRRCGRAYRGKTQAVVIEQIRRQRNRAAAGSPRVPPLRRR